MLNLRVFRILDYYDFPQLLHCKDRYDSNYISVLAEVSENYLYYIATKITNNSIDELYKNICDVSSLFSVDNPFFDFKLHNETEEWFSINETSYEHIKSYIPEEGLFIDYEIEEDFISKKALEINKTIFELHLAEGPSNSVATNTLVDFLTYTQKIFDYSYSAVSKKLSSKIKKRIKENNSSQMNVFSFQPGSLKVNFVTNAFVDMLGNSDDELLIDKLREIFEVHGNAQDIVSVLRGNKGNLISSIEKLCKKIIESDVDFELNYSLPKNFMKQSIVVKKSKAQLYYDLIIKKNELKKEELKFSGYFVAVDLKSGKWKFICDDGKDINGSSSVELLSGLIIDTEEYNIVCNEVVLQENISEKDIVEFSLVSVS